MAWNIPPQTEADWVEMLRVAKLKFKECPVTANHSYPWSNFTDDSWKSDFKRWFNKVHLEPHYYRAVYEVWMHYCDSSPILVAPKTLPQSTACVCCYRESNSAPYCKNCENNDYRNRDKYREEQKNLAAAYVRSVVLRSFREFPNHCCKLMNFGHAVADCQVTVTFSCDCGKKIVKTLAPRKD